VTGRRFEFDRDPAKAASNLVKHRVSFEDAMGVFLDPLACPGWTTRMVRRKNVGSQSGSAVVQIYWWSCIRTWKSTMTGSLSAASPRESRRNEKSASMSRKAKPSASDMKDEYDFTGAVRGKFYREGAELIPPVHLEPEVLNYLRARAEARGTSLNELVKKDIELIEAAR
jgi:uncharacterized DUF497 family protein